MAETNAHNLTETDEVQLEQPHVADTALSELNASNAKVEDTLVLRGQ